MVYEMKFKVDGACRRNGRRGATGAAAACLFDRNGRYWTRAEELPDNYRPPTNNKVEILAIILALRWALERYQSLRTAPYLELTIESDSKYAVNGLTSLIQTWIDRGWYNCKGLPVANRDLLQQAHKLMNELSEIGKLKLSYLPRWKNKEADAACNEYLDQL